MRRTLRWPTSIGRSIPTGQWLAIVGLMTLAALTLHLEHSKRVGEALQAAVGRLPSGISAAQVEERLGSADEIQFVTGVLRFNTLYTAENAKAKEYGAPRRYEVRLWRRGAVRAAVYIDGEGCIAGRTVWNRRRELHGGFFDSLGLVH